MNRGITFKFIFFILTAACVLYGQQEPFVEQLQSVDAFTNPIYRGSYAAAGNIVSFVSTNNVLKLLDAASLKEKATLPILPTRVTAMSLSKTGQALAVSTQDGKVFLFNTTTGVPTATVSSKVPVVTLGVQDDNWIFSTSGENVLSITDVTTSDVLGKLSNVPEEITALAVYPSSKFFALGTASGAIRIYAVAQFSPLKVLTDVKDKISTLAYTPDGKYLLAGTMTGGTYIWDAQTNVLKGKWNDQKGSVLSVAVDPKSRWIVSASSDSTVRMYDLGKLVSVKQLRDSSGYAAFITFTSDETMITATSKGSIKKWKVTPTPPDTTDPSIVILHPANTTLQAPRNYYGTDMTISGYVYDDSGVKEVTLGGVPVKLDAISTADTMIKVPAGMKAKQFTAQASLDSTGVHTIEFGVKDIANHTVKQKCFINRLTHDQALELLSPSNNAETDLISVPVRFKTWFDIATYSISVNMSDIVIGQEPALNVVNNDITETIPLLVGYNQIEITTVNKTGDRFSKTLGITRKANTSFSMPSLAGGKKKARAAGSGPQQWAVVVGVSDYQNSGVPSLKYADKDAESFAAFLQRPEGGAYDSDHLRVLLNKDATLANVKDALINFLSQAIDMDLVIIYFAGHGAPEPARPQNVYLLTYDSNPAELGTTAFPMWDIQTVLARYINAKRVVVFTDACHSGNISVNFATRGLGVTEDNMVNQYLTDLSKTKEGIVVFTASAAGEVSQEYPEYGHGVFSYFLLQGLQGKADYNNDYTISINELMQYVEEQVKRKTHGSQNPTRSQTEYDKEMTIAVVPH